jgi:threonine dehydratase
VAIVASGGNIDVNLLDRIIGHGLAKAGRLMRLTVELRDRPGELQGLLAAITEQGANVRAIQHDRTRRDVRIGGARVTLELETRGHAHIERIREALAASGHQVLIEE